jgi:hypothetical protein
VQTIKSYWETFWTSESMVFPECGGHPEGHQDTVTAKSSSHVRESVLFIGTQFSILYTFMYSPA